MPCWQSGHLTWPRKSIHSYSMMGSVPTLTVPKGLRAGGVQCGPEEALFSRTVFCIWQASLAHALFNNHQVEQINARSNPKHPSS